MRITDGDTYVWFKTANVLPTGDTFTSGLYPTSILPMAATSRA